MRIELTSPHHDLDEQLHEHAERRFLFALSRFSNRLRTVRIRIHDVNGPRGGVDVRCTVDLRGPGLPPLRAEVLDASVEAALDRAAEVAGRLVAKTVALARSDVRRTRSHSGLRGLRG